LLSSPSSRYIDAELLADADDSLVALFRMKLGDAAELPAVPVVPVAPGALGARWMQPVMVTVLSLLDDALELGV
jgi:hypothetical protein